MKSGQNPLFQNLYFATSMRCLFFNLLLLLAVTPRLKANEPLPAGSEKGISISIPVLSSDSSSSTIPFNRVGNLIVLKAKVDTIEGNFILDTGAPHLVLNLTYFRDYPVTVKQDEDQASIAGRGDMIQQTTVRNLSFGAMTYNQLEADLVNLGNIENAKGLKVIGLLGLDLFRQCELIIDFEKSLIYLHRIGKKEASTYKHPMLDDASSYQTYPIEFSFNRMTTTTEIAGKKLKMVIDCAAESNILDSRLPEKVFDFVTITRKVKLTGPSDKKVDALYGSLASMMMGTQQIENLQVVILNLEYTCFADDICVNGVLGFDFLSQHKIGFNFVKRKMYIWK
jgi:hypothetical protein